LAPRVGPTTKLKGLVPPFDIVPLNPFDEEEFESFKTVWPDVGSDELDTVAYKTISSGGDIIVYYSEAFAPYREQLERLKEKASLSTLFIQNYEIWVGYHAIMQWQERTSISEDTGLDDDTLEKLQERERALVATMQVKEVLSMSEIQSAGLRAETSD
jgi:hypothetical protein